MDPTPKESKKYSEVLKVYIDSGWKIHYLDDIQDFISTVEDNLSDSYGGNPPIITDKGWVFVIPVDADIGDYLIVSYHTKDTDYLNKITDEEFADLVRKDNDNAELDNEEFVGSLRKKFGNYIANGGRVFFIEDGTVSDSLAYFYFFDNKTKSVSVNSITARCGDELLPLCSDAYRNKFNKKDDADYVINIVLVAISFILEKFK